jgi:hypothetical protein|eukprot:COSAG01_NODE_739_length_13898_cov_29.871223_14_plen_88_part_00
MVDTTGFESEGQKGPPYPDEFGDPASTGKIGKVKERVRAIKELKKFVDMAGQIRSVHPSGAVHRTPHLILCAPQYSVPPQKRTSTPL